MLLFRKASVWLILVAIQLLAAHGNTIRMSTYSKQELCNLGDRIDNGCYRPQSSSSFLDCAVNCQANENCTEFIYSAQKSACYLLSSCAFSPACYAFDSDLKLYVAGNEGDSPKEVTEGPCANGGIFDGVDSCICSTTGGMVGDLCQTLPRSCLELQNSGYADGEYPVTLDLMGDGSQLVQCVCVLKIGVAEIDIIRSSGSFNTNYGYATYQTGYYLGPNDYFIGLKTMSAIMAIRSDVTATVYYNSSEFQGKAWITFPNMHILTVGEDYLLIQQTFEKSQGSSFEPPETSSSGLVPNEQIINTYIASVFSTPDNDRDGYLLANCAQASGRGWWHAFGLFCLNINPLGWNYKALPGPPTPEHVTIPGVDASRLQDAFHYFSLSYKQS